MTGESEKESPVPLAAKSLRAVPDPPGELEMLFHEHRPIASPAALPMPKMCCKPFSSGWSRVMKLTT